MPTELVTGMEDVLSNTEDPRLREERSIIEEKSSKFESDSDSLNSSPV